MSETHSIVPFTGPNGIGNEFLQALAQSGKFNKILDDKMTEALAKADTVSQATNLLWYDLKPVIQMLYPFRELIPRISKLPRTSADGGNAYHWKRVTAINVNGISSGVSEGNRGARIAINEQDMTAAFKTLGLESSVTFEARLGARNLRPEALGISVQSALRSLMIDEEKILINGNASMPLGTTPTPTLAHGTLSGLTGTFTPATPVYVACVALSGFGWAGYTTYSSASLTGGVPGQITKTNADATTDTYGGGSAAPSAIATTTPAAGECITATVAPVVGASGGYAWYLGLTAASPGTMYLAGITPSNQAIFRSVPAATNQPLNAIYVGGNPVDNSTNVLVPDGILPQINGAIFGPDPGRLMASNPIMPTGVTVSRGGSLVYALATGNTGLTVAGSNINEFDSLLRAAYDQYKLGFARILMSSQDMLDTFGVMLAQSSAANIFRIMFDADAETGRIVAGRKVTSYHNKFFGNTLDVEVHPWMPPGTIVFWSDQSPYELSGVGNILEAVVRQDYYQIQWPWRARRYEYGVYVDEVFSMYFSPAFAVITNKNPSTGNFVF